MKKTAKIILVSAGAAMLMAGGVLGAVAVYDTADPRSSGEIVVKTEHVNLVWGADGEHENTDAFEVAITDLNTTATDRYLTVAIEPEEGNTLAAGTYKGTLAFSITSSAKDSMILPKLAVEVAEDETENKVSMGADYKANLVVELTEQKKSALVKISYKLTENFGELTQEELTALAAEKLTATADWNIYSETPAPADPVFVDGYYITGKINGEAHWADLDGTAYSLPMTTENIADTNYAELVEVDLKAGDEVRAVKVENKQVEYFDVNGIPNHGNYVAEVDGKYSFYLGGKSDNAPLLYVTAPEAPVEPATEVTANIYSHYAIPDEDVTALKEFAWVWTIGQQDGVWYEAEHIEKYTNSDNRHWTISVVNPVGKGVLLGLFADADLTEGLPGADCWGKIQHQSGDGTFAKNGDNIYADLDAKSAKQA